MSSYKRIRVFPDRDLRATRIELAVMDTASMQRLRHVRQLGQSYLVYPTAEHSRFSHSLGVLYWASKMLSYLRDNYYAASNRPALTAIDEVLTRSLSLGELPDPSAILDVTWIEQFIRLYALLHDLTHIPFGHTLEDQSGLLPRHDEDPERITFAFARLVDELQDSPHFDCEHGDHLRRITVSMVGACKYIAVIGHALAPPTSASYDPAVWGTFWDEADSALLPAFILAYDLVSNTICADLLDYSLRDSLFTSMPKSFDKAVLSSLKILRSRTELHPPIRKTILDAFRLGVAVTRTKLRHDVITAILELLRSRYDLTEKVYYHHAKCAADAMLEKVLRCHPSPLTWQHLIERGIGDEGVLLLIEESCGGPDVAGSEWRREILRRLRNRRFYKAVYRITQDTTLSPRASEMKKKAGTPQGRTELEDQIIRDANNAGAHLQQGSIIVSCLPSTMQWKIAKALIEWPDGDVLPLHKLGEEKHYAGEVESLTRRYPDLWSLSVYLHPDALAYVAVIEALCEDDVFGVANDRTLAPYLRERWGADFRGKAIAKHIAMRAVAKDASERASAAKLAGKPDEKLREKRVRKLVAEEAEAADGHGGRRAGRSRDQLEQNPIGLPIEDGNSKPSLSSE